MENDTLDYNNSYDYKFAKLMTSQFVEGIDETPDKRPFFEGCLGVGAEHISLKSKCMLPEDGFGHVDLGFIPDLTPASLVRALRASGGYGELCIVGAVWFARDIQFRGEKEGDVYGYNLCMTLLEKTLRAYFANRE